VIIQFVQITLLSLTLGAAKYIKWICWHV